MGDLKQVIKKVVALDKSEKEDYYWLIPNNV